MVLEHVCQLFNKAGITYVLSCSAALFLQGIVDDFNDFDVLIALQDKQKTEDAMIDAGGTLEVTIQKPCFTSPYYREALLQNEHFDLVGDITVSTYNTEYCYKVIPEECEYITLEGNINVSMCPVEANFLLYAMMEGWQSKRLFKRELCREYLSVHALKHPQIFEQALKEQQLPPWIRKLVLDLL